MWTNILAGLLPGNMSKKALKKAKEAPPIIELDEDGVEVKVVCDEDVENLLYLKGAKVPKGTTPDTKNRRRLSSSDMFDDEEDDDVDEIFKPQAPRVLFAESPGRAKPSRPDLTPSRGRRRSSIAIGGTMQTIPETEEVRLPRKRGAQVEEDEPPGTPDRKRTRASAERELPRTPRTPRTPNTRKIEPKTPESGRKITRKVADTPRIQRTNVKKCINEVLNEDDDDFEDTDDDDSCYSDSGDDEEAAPLEDKSLVTPKKESAAVSKRPARVAKEVKSYSTDDYFYAHVTSKVMTSNHSLSRLKKAQLDQETIQNVLQKSSKKHEKECKVIMKNHEAKFKRWQCLLLEGFSLLLYGLGSKAELINSLRRFLASDEDDAIVINGFFPSLTLREIFSSIIRDVMEMPTVPSDEHECCSLIERHFNRSDSQQLYLLVNNLDGQALQTSKAQNAIARISTAKNIHLVATIDHINAPLLLDQGLLAKLNLVWQDTTTMRPYLEETAFENSVMVQQSGKLALASLHSVFQSLTANAKSILNILMENQLASKESQYQGMSFRDLYHEAREQFVVSSDLALRGQLTEFLDHKLVKIKKGMDGSEMLHLPLSHAILREFKNTHEFESN